MVYSEYNIQIIINMIGKYTSSINDKQGIANDVRLELSAIKHFPDADR